MSCRLELLASRSHGYSLDRSLSRVSKGPRANNCHGPRLALIRHRRLHGDGLYTCTVLLMRLSMAVPMWACPLPSRHDRNFSCCSSIAAHMSTYGKPLRLISLTKSTASRCVDSGYRNDPQRSSCSSNTCNQERPQDSAEGVNAPLPPEAKEFLKSDYEMVHSEVYLNKCVISIAPFSTPACPDCSQNVTYKHRKLLFCMFSLFNFSSIFPGGQLIPFAPMCGRPCL